MLETKMVEQSEVYHLY